MEKSRTLFTHIFYRLYKKRIADHKITNKTIITAVISQVFSLSLTIVSDFDKIVIKKQETGRWTLRELKPLADASFFRIFPLYRESERECGKYRKNLFYL